MVDNGIVARGGKWTHPEDKICDECGLTGIEPSYRNLRRLHIACAQRRKSAHRHRQNNPDALQRERSAQAEVRERARAERYAADPVYRARVDVLRLHSTRDRPYLEGLRWRVLWTRYRLRESDFLRLLAWQNDACPCGDPFDGQPSVDHDHGCCPSAAQSKCCGKCVRGLLHTRCNILLAVIENNPDVIQPAGWVQKYLAQPPYQEMIAALPSQEML